MGKLRVVARPSTSSRVHGANNSAHRSGLSRLTERAAGGHVAPEGQPESVVEIRLCKSELSDSGTELRRLLEAVRPSAPSDVTSRLEGAIIVLDALAAGKHPSADDLLVPGPYTV